MGNLKQYNINNRIYFLPTKRGLDMWKKDFERYGVGKEYTFYDMLKQYITVDGWCYLAMWEFCRIFGKEMDMGFDNVVETNVRFENVDLVEVVE